MNEIDFRLLVALHALLDTESVSGAARRSGVTQSAMSHTLARLRDLFGDPLLVRSGRAMRPTPRALELREPLAELVASARRLISRSQRFDPATSERRFALSAPDSAALVLLPPLLRRLARNAPRVDLEVAAAGPDRPFEALERGDLDVAIGRFDTVPAGFVAEPLYREEFVCIVRRDHPLVGRRMTLPTYTRLAHLLIAPRGGRRGQVDDALEAVGERRRVAVIVPQFLLAPFVVASTDLVLTVSRRVADGLSDLLGLRRLTPPVEVAGYDYQQIWHERWHDDPASCWFRGQLASVAQRGQ
jgi:DNA-binding transcriptional LysR family regulator